jgi:hypothetical protein
VVEQEKDVFLDFEYRSELFRKQTVEGMAKHLLNILNEVVTRPQVKIANVEMLGREEENRLITEVKIDEDTAYPIDKEPGPVESTKINAEFDF